MPQLKPSPQNYPFRVADVANSANGRGMPEALSGGMRADIPQTIIQHMIEQAQDAFQSRNGDMLMLALLTQILRDMQPKNARFLPFPYTLAAWTKIQLIPANPSRSYFIVQNVGQADIMVVFEEGPMQPQDFSGSANDQAQLTRLQTRAVRIIAGGVYEPLIPPRNAVTIFTLGTATQGLVIEGSS